LNCVVKTIDHHIESSSEKNVGELERRGWEQS